MEPTFSTSSFSRFIYYLSNTLSQIDSCKLNYTIIVDLKIKGLYPLTFDLLNQYQCLIFSKSCDKLRYFIVTKSLIVPLIKDWQYIQWKFWLAVKNSFSVVSYFNQCDILD